MVNLAQFFSSDMVDATLYQYASGSYDDAGVWVSGSASTTDVRVLALQPLDAERADLVREGEDIVDYRWTMADSSLPISVRASGVDCDQIDVDGVRYAVRQVERYDAQSGTVEVTLVKI